MQFNLPHMVPFIPHRETRLYYTDEYQAHLGCMVQQAPTSVLLDLLDPMYGGAHHALMQQVIRGELARREELDDYATWEPT